MSTTVKSAAIEVRPMAVGIGAEIGGLDLSRPLAADVVAELRAVLLEWKVIFFRDQTIGPAEHLRFSRYFGIPTPAHPTLPSLDGFPEILPLASREGERSSEAVIDSRWHSDVTFLPDPPMGSILHGLEVPPYGGDTQWTNLVRAYERLSAPIRHFVDGLTAVHHNQLQVERIGTGIPNELQAAFSARPLAAVHPVVAVHPETGEPALCVNPTFTSHIVELSARESGRVLGMLYEQIARPEFTVRFRWEARSIAFWDNRSTAHLAPQELPFLSVDERAVVGRRSMHRITLRGQPLTGPTGVRSHAIDGDRLLH